MKGNRRDGSQYSGRLTPQQATVGMNAAHRNGRRLASDARLLIGMGRYPTACALAILAIEEAGKVSILRGLVLERSDSLVRQAWKNYRSHTSKNVNWILPELVHRGARTLDDLRVIVDSKSRHPRLIEQVKQIATYTDCFQRVKWSEPSEVVNQKLAEMLVVTAEVLTAERETTVEEMELWVRYMAPVWRQSLGVMKRAMLAWHQQCKAQNLIPQTEDMGMFLGLRSESVQ